MNPINIFSKKHIYASIAIIILMLASHSALKLHLYRKNNRVEHALASTYKNFQLDLQASWKSFEQYSQDFLQKNTTITSHQVTEPLHKSITQAFLLSADLEQVPPVLKNDSKWQEIEKILNLCNGIDTKTNSPCFQEKNGPIFIWLCAPIHHNDKFAGYLLGKKIIDSAFTKEAFNFFIVQEFQLPISLSGQQSIPPNIPTLSDENTFDNSTFRTKVNNKNAIFATQFNSDLTMGFVAMYKKGPVETAFLIFIILLFLALVLLWVHQLIAMANHFGKKIYDFISKHQATIITILCSIFGTLALKYSMDIHHTIKKTRIILTAEHSSKNVALAQKINTACLIGTNKIASKDVVEKILQEYTPTRIESLFIADSTKKVLFKYAQSHMVAQDFLCKLVGTSHANYKIEIPNWTLHSTYAIAYQELPLHNFRREFILFMIFFTIFIILCWYAYCIVLDRKLTTWLSVVLPLLGFCNIVLWATVNYIPVTFFDSTNAIKTPADNILLGAKADIIAGNKQLLPPTRTTLGLLLQNLDLTQVNRSVIQGLMWQVSSSAETLGFIIANEQDGKIEEVSKTEINKMYKILWRLFGKITTPDDYKCYPFSVKNVKIGIGIQNTEKPTLIIPDPALLQLNRIPWLAPQVITPGYSLIEHSITSEFPKNNALKNVSHGFSNTVYFNLSYRESLIGALFTYIFPLFIILLAIFGILWVPGPFRFTAYSGVFFADILLHRTLRSSLNLVQVCYLDCFFFYTYLALILLMCGTLLALSKPHIASSVDRFFKSAYWPVQLILWLVTTAWFFCW